VHVGLATVRLALPATSSLKDKRSIIRSGVAQLRKRYNVSVAEVGALSTFRAAELALTAVSTSKPRLDAMLDSAVRFLERDPRVVLEGVQVEFL
jgi:uncharacterized protein YlxP (DUF503 family)